MVAQKVEAQRLVFVDEMGTNTSLSSLYAWAPKGRRALCSVPHNRGKNTTLLASMSAEGMGPCLAVVGSTTKAVFEAGSTTLQTAGHAHPRVTASPCANATHFPKGRGSSAPLCSNAKKRDMV